MGLARAYGAEAALCCFDPGAGVLYPNIIKFLSFVFAWEVFVKLYQFNVQRQHEMSALEISMFVTNEHRQPFRLRLISVTLLEAGNYCEIMWSI